MDVVRRRILVKRDERETGVKVRFKSYSKSSFHWHNSVELLYIISGEVEFVNWDSKLRFGEGDFVVVDINNTHLIRVLSQECQTMEIHISDELCKEHIEDVRDRVIHCYSTLEKTHENITENLDKIRTYLMEIKESYSTMDEVEIEKNSIECLKILFDKFDFISNGEKLMGLDKKRESRCKDIYKRYFLNKKTNITLKEIASLKEINYHHLSKDIRKTYGKNYKKLKFSYLLEDAARGLISTRKNITEISYECGFSDPKYFIKYFKEKYECTPNEFRNKYRNSFEN